VTGDDPTADLFDRNLIPLFLKAEGAADQVQEDAEFDFGQEGRYPIEENIGGLGIERRVEAGESRPVWRGFEIIGAGGEIVVTWHRDPRQLGRWRGPPDAHNLPGSSKDPRGRPVESCHLAGGQPGPGSWGGW